MAELADALDSGSSIVKDVQVQLLLSAPEDPPSVDKRLMAGFILWQIAAQSI